MPRKKRQKNAYDKEKGENEDEVGSINDLIGTLNTTKGEAASDLKTARSDRISEKNTLDGHLDAIAAAEPGCNFFVVNYAVRRSNRHIEIDGLIKAKAILRGAKFDALDENREIKPGDAFLQRRRA